MSANRTQITTTTSTAGPSMSCPIPPAPANPANHEDDEEEILRQAQEWVRRVRARKAAEAAKRKAEEEAARAAEVRKKAAQERALRAQQQEEEAVGPAVIARSQRGTSPSEVSIFPRRPVVEIPKGKGKAKAQPVGEDPNDGSNGDNDNGRAGTLRAVQEQENPLSDAGWQEDLLKKEGSSHPIASEGQVKANTYHCHFNRKLDWLMMDAARWRRLPPKMPATGPSELLRKWRRVVDSEEEEEEEREKGREEEEEVDEEPAQSEREE
ncbi:hypothetical protein F5877DRAFT_85019 [Lentinula edodes]|nr:hypothetical protein F5877DRAFT_85019 [Lentinula edodes]